MPDVPDDQRTTDKTTVDAAVSAVAEYTDGPDSATFGSEQTAGSSILISGPKKSAAQVLWVAMSLAVLALAAAGVGARIDEMQVPCEGAEDCFIAQLTQEEIDALADGGIAIESYVLYLEAVAGVLVLGCFIAAILIYWRRRDSWIALISSLFLIVVSAWVTFNIDALGRANESFSPVAGALYGTAMFLVALLLLMFPNGRFTPRWSRWVALAWGLYLAARTVAPGAAAAVEAQLPWIAPLPNLMMFLGGAAAQVHRYLRVSTPIEKQQTKWVTIALVLHMGVFAVITVVTMVLPAVTGGQLFPGVWSNVVLEVVLYHLYVLTFLLIPGSLIFSVLRYRLWDIDFLINRSLIYGALTATLLLFFGVSVLVLQKLFVFATDGQQLPLVIGFSALLVGLVFQPTRRFLQRFVDRELYGIGVDYADAARRLKQEAKRQPLPADQHSVFSEYGEFTLIGRGGMAEVYRAVHPRLDRRFAVKMLPPETAERHKRYIQRFEREARIISALNHPNIVSMHDFGVSEDGSRYIVMQYISGGDLEHEIKRNGAYPLPRALPLLRDISRALDYAHSHGIIHRDIKPSNVLLEPVDATDPERSHRAVLSDFGIAKLSAGTDLTATNIIGTLDYMSPEQINDSADVDERADVYSLGVLAFRMLTGKRPFSSTSPTALLIAHLNQPAPDPRVYAPELPRHVARAVRKAMAKKPHHRYSSVGSLVTAMSGVDDLGRPATLSDDGEDEEESTMG